MDILSDILLNSKLSPDMIERERAVILVSMPSPRLRLPLCCACRCSNPLCSRGQREEEEVSKSEEEVTFDRLHSMAYQGTPLDKLILGSRENIAKISRDDLVEVRVPTVLWARTSWPHNTALRSPFLTGACVCYAVHQDALHGSALCVGRCRCDRSRRAV